MAPKKKLDEESMDDPQIVRRTRVVLGESEDDNDNLVTQARLAGVSAYMRELLLKFIYDRGLQDQYLMNVKGIEQINRNRIWQDLPDDYKALVAANTFKLILLPNSAVVSIPTIDSFHKIAAILSYITKTNVSGNMLIGLIPPPVLGTDIYDADAPPPESMDIDGYVGNLAKDVVNLPAELRIEIAPPILEVILEDFKFHTADPWGKFVYLLRREVKLCHYITTKVEGRFPGFDYKEIKDLFSSQSVTIPSTDKILALGMGILNYDRTAPVGFDFIKASFDYLRD